MNEDTRNYVYVIINEWGNHNDELTLSEVVGARFFWSMEEAWEHLKMIADKHGVELSGESNGFDAPLNHEVTQEYYIEELWSNG